MIQNRRQYGVTKAQVKRLEDALAAAKQTEGMPPRVYDAMVAGIQSQIDELDEQRREYDGVCRASRLRMDSVEHLADVLIKARIARGLTQKELAEKLGIQPQQIQKYEASAYRSASLKRVQEVMKALDLDFEAEIALEPDPAPDAGRPVDDELEALRGS